MDGGLGLLPGDDDALLLGHGLREYRGVGLDIAAGVFGGVDGVLPADGIRRAGSMRGAAGIAVGADGAGRVGGRRGGLLLGGINGGGLGGGCLHGTVGNVPPCHTDEPALEEAACGPSRAG